MTDFLIGGAADWELGPLLDALEDRVEERQTIWTFWRGRIASSDVVVMRTDWGPINAVGAAAIGIQTYLPGAVITQGMAGAHNPALNVGDIVAAEAVADASAFKSRPAAAGEGIDYGRREKLAHRFRVPGPGQLTAYERFVCDESLLRAALKTANPRGRVVPGVVGSGYQFNREIDAIEATRRIYGTDCEDMESAFVGGIATALGVPMMAIRMISNSEWNHPVLDKSTGTACAEFVVRLVRSLDGRRRPGLGTE